MSYSSTLVIYSNFFFSRLVACPFLTCDVETRQLNAHLIKVHGISRYQFGIMLNYKANTKRAAQYLVCPRCSFITTRLDKHLINAHKLRGTLEKVKLRERYMKEARDVSTYSIMELVIFSFSITYTIWYM